jgi:hypothetical protein
MKIDLGSEYPYKMYIINHNNSAVKKNIFRSSMYFIKRGGFGIV